MRRQGDRPQLLGKPQSAPHSEDDSGICAWKPPTRIIGILAAMNKPVDYLRLKQKHQTILGDQRNALSLRLYRALSWLKRAEQEADDEDARFIFTWIALNAAYSNEIPQRMRFSETRLFSHFLTLLVERDQEQRLYQIVWNDFSGAIRLFLNNKYVYQPFWDFQKGETSEAQWRQKFERSKASAHRALGKMDTRKVLMVIFERLYVLRNQLFHGSATWNSSKNREQLRDGLAILEQLVPAIIDIMLQNANQVWGEPRYPVID